MEGVRIFLTLFFCNRRKLDPIPNVFHKTIYENSKLLSLRYYFKLLLFYGVIRTNRISKDLKQSVQ